MKYGPIICDPTSEEAKKLIGKRVITNNRYNSIANPDDGFSHKVVLKRIDPNYIHPFVAEYEGTIWSSTFIREVIEEKPKYRPYKNTEEMISDFCERFGFVKTDFAFPIIWIRNKEYGTVLLLTHFTETNVLFRDMDKIFDNFTYLDGSPVGKEKTE